MPLQPNHNIQASTGSNTPDEDNINSINQSMEYDETSVSSIADLQQNEKVIHQDFYNDFGDLCDY